jgi:Ca-activated chloride channel family protein
VSFGWPVALAGLVLVPLLAGTYVWSERRRRRSQARFGNPDLLPNLVERSPGRLRALPVAISLVALAAMIVGVARPHATVSVPREEATIVLALDVSRSMKATDVQPTRLDAARAAAKELLAETPEAYRVGVVSFADRASVGVVPTEDRDLVESALDSLVPGEGTALGDAVALSLKVGQPQPGTTDEPPPPRSILVFSDGARDGGRLEPAEAAKLAKEAGVPVYSVLLGTGDGVVEETLPGGLRRIIRVPPSPETLQLVSTETGGELLSGPDVESTKKVFEELGSRLGSKDVSREITDVFAAVALALVLAAAAISAFFFRRVP